MTQEFSHGLKPKTVESLHSVFRNHPHIQKAILYGSRAKGTANLGSDIDLTLVGDKLTTTELLKIETEIDDLMLPYKIDLSLLAQIDNPDLIEHIQQLGQNFYLSVATS
jgi:predicted nucleotidyltransferase